MRDLARTWASRRFEPTCSVYAQEAIERFGALRGSVLAMRRICAAIPLHEAGLDPVPLPAPTDSRANST